MKEQPFNIKLKELRLDKKLRLIDVANAIGLTLRAISNYEAGTREPSLDILIKLCRFFDTTPNYLLGFSDY